MKRFISLYVPVTNCNLRCHYCYITHKKLFEGSLPELPYSPDTVRKALSVKRLGGASLINICASGETLLPPEIVDYVFALLEEGHCVMVVTNGTISSRFAQFALFPSSLLKRLFFKFSYHYLELEKKGLLEVFFDNVNLMSRVGASYTIEVTPSDELLPFVESLTDLAVAKVGAAPHYTIARDQRHSDGLPILTDFTHEEYFKLWGRQSSSLFNFKQSLYGVKRGEFCYAGAWSAYVNLQTGLMRQCYCSFYEQKIFDDMQVPIRFHPVGNNCTQPYCYNGHAFLALGVIPELKTPSFGELRDRVRGDGCGWLSPEIKSFFDSRLAEENFQAGVLVKFRVNVENRIRRMVQGIVGQIKKVIKIGLRK